MPDGALKICCARAPIRRQDEPRRVPQGPPLHGRSIERAWHILGCCSRALQLHHGLEGVEDEDHRAGIYQSRSPQFDAGKGTTEISRLVLHIRNTGASRRLPALIRQGAQSQGTCRPAQAGAWRQPSPHRTADAPAWSPGHHGTAAPSAHH